MYNLSLPLSVLLLLHEDWCSLNFVVAYFFTQFFQHYILLKILKKIRAIFNYVCRLNFRMSTESDRTCNYCVKMKLDRDIPQLLPMWGRRVKIFYGGVQKLCTNFFGKHNKDVCKSRKAYWSDYVSAVLSLKMREHQ